MNDRKESPNASTPVTLLAALLCIGLRGGEGGERREPGEGRSAFQLKLLEPLTPTLSTQVGPARPAHYLCRTRASTSSVGRGSPQCSWRLQLSLLLHPDRLRDRGDLGALLRDHGGEIGGRAGAHRLAERREL